MSSTTDWYNHLDKPSWAPKAALFGTVWGVLYPIIIAVNIWVIVLFARGTISWKIALPFWLNLVANLLFTPLQFGLRSNALALVDIIVVLATTAWAMWAIWPHNRLLAIAFVPYLLWVAFATVLQTSITWLNA